jgi:hypothetical protein
MSATKRPSPEPETPPRRVLDKAALQRKLRNYYQLECVRPTSQRLQLFLDEFLRKAAVSPEIDRRAQSAGDH